MPWESTNEWSTNAAPSWAVELIARVCADYSVPVPVLKWSNAPARKGSSWARGTGYSHTYQLPRRRKYQLSIRGGMSDEDNRLVVLHELGHWIMPWGEHHGSRFWQLAFELYGRYGVNFDYAKAREEPYRKKAGIAAMAARR